MSGERSYAESLVASRLLKSSCLKEEYSSRRGIMKRGEEKEKFSCVES